jgi:SAM-dependent methyltransferase
MTAELARGAARCLRLRSAVYRALCAEADFARPIAQRPLVRRLLGDAAGRAPVDLALDVGAGRGLYTPALLARARRVIAVEYDAGNAAALRARFAPPAHPVAVVRADATRLPLGAGVADLVACLEVLEHVPDDRAAAAELARALKAGAGVVVSVPVPPAPLDDPEHVREGYTPEALDALLDGAGLAARQRRFALYGPSKLALRAASWWRRRLGFRAPSALKLLCWLERALNRPGGLGRKSALARRLLGQPYDQIVYARKE